jgi:hypothetical protein
MMIRLVRNLEFSLSLLLAFSLRQIMMFRRREGKSQERTMTCQVMLRFQVFSISDTDTSPEGPHTSPRHSTSTSSETKEDAMDDECLSEGDIACTNIAGDVDENEGESILGESLHTSYSSVEDSMDVMKNLARTPEAARTVFENETPTPNETPETPETPSPYNATSSEATPADLSIPDLRELRRTLSLQDDSAAEDSSGIPVLATLSIPTLNAGFIHAAVVPENKSFESEECKEEIADTMEEIVSEEPFDSPALHLSIPLVRRESFTTTASEFTYGDESTVDHACPICLGGYKKGDMLSASNHCPHMFHKDCILEWLEQHDECPMCRVKMITDNEMNKAATSLVGKTRMYRAVAAYQPAPRTPRAAPSLPNSRTRTSPFMGTMRRSAQQNDS